MIGSDRAFGSTYILQSAWK